MNRLTTAVVGLITLLAASQARAQIALSEYQHFQQNEPDREALNHYLLGVARGLWLANEALKIRGQKPVFCLPDSWNPQAPLTLNDELLRQELKKPKYGRKYAPSTPIEIILLYAYESRFPCK